MQVLRGIAFDCWPAPHREAYDRAQENADNIDSPILAENWAPETHRSVKSVYGLWLAHLASRGIAIAERPSDTITLENVEPFVRDLLTRVSLVTVATYLRNLSEAIRIMDPGVWLPRPPRSQRKRFATFAADPPGRTLLRLALRDFERAAQPAEDDVTAKVSLSILYWAAVLRMDAVKETSLLCKSDGQEFQSGLIVAMEVLTGLRLRTLSLATQSDINFDGETTWLFFPKHKVKTRKDLIRSVHEHLTPYIKHGVRVAHSLAGDQPFKGEMWLTRSGKPISRGWLAKRIKATTRELVGVPLGPQRIRRLGPTNTHQFAPWNMSGATAMMQHHSPAQTFDSYVKAGGIGTAHAFYHLRARKFEAHPEKPEQTSPLKIQRLNIEGTNK